jgi:hypothetical protein
MGRYNGKSGYLSAVSCIGKRQYASQEAADSTIRVVYHGNTNMSSYYCVYCGLHHIGHNIGTYKANMVAARKKAHILANTRQETKRAIAERLAKRREELANASTKLKNDKPSIPDRMGRGTPQRPDPVHSTGQWTSFLGDRVRYS